MHYCTFEAYIFKYTSILTFKNIKLYEVFLSNFVCNYHAEDSLLLKTYDVYVACSVVEQVISFYQKTNSDEKA